MLMLQGYTQCGRDNRMMKSTRFGASIDHNSWLVTLQCCDQNGGYGEFKPPLFTLKRRRIRLVGSGSLNIEYCPTVNAVFDKSCLLYFGIFR